MPTNRFPWRAAEVVPCPGCGAEHQLEKKSEPMRDKDQLECPSCDQVIKTWNGGCEFRIRPA